MESIYMQKIRSNYGREHKKICIYIYILVVLVMRLSISKKKIKHPCI